MYAETPPATSYIPSPPPPNSRSVFGTRIPASVTIITGILLFFLPFVELKCKSSDKSGINIQKLANETGSLTNTGFGLATGQKWKLNMPAFGDLFKEDKTSAFSDYTGRQDPNNYAIVALALAVAGVCLALVDKRIAATLNVAVMLAAAGALVGLMLDIKKKTNNVITQSDAAGSDFVSINFTPWFYITVIAFMAAAVFSFLRLRSMKP